MIIGFGTDIVEIKRIEAVYQKQGQRFLDRVFTPAEQNLALSREGAGRMLQTLATRFAVKEACAKALGCGFRGGVEMKEIEVVHGAQSCPQLVLSGTALEVMNGKTPDVHKAHMHVSLSDEKNYATASVIFEVREIT